MNYTDQVKGNSLNYAQGVEYKKLSEQAKELKQPLLCVVYLNDIAPYNEYDHDCNGGYFNCPYCKEQIYKSSAEIGEEYECDCGRSFVFE